MGNELNSKFSQLGGMSTNRSDGAPKLTSYLDEMGRETFYIKNVSDMGVYLTCLAGIVARGEVIDLLTRTDIETVSKDQSLRAEIDRNKTLKRLTKEEYVKEYSDYEEMLRRKEVERNEIGLRPTVSEDKPVISIEVMDKIDRLKYYYSPDQKSAENCVTPNEFMEWLILAKLSLAEIDHILNNAPNAEIKAFLFKKKQEIISMNNTRY